MELNRLIRFVMLAVVALLPLADAQEAKLSSKGTHLRSRSLNSCGNGKCNIWSETCSSCPEDCGSCKPVPNNCGDGECGAGESCDGRKVGSDYTQSCPTDCDGVTSGKPSERFCYVEGNCVGKCP